MVILNRFQPQTEKIVPEEQACFRAGRSTTEQIFNLRMCEALDHEGDVSIGGRLITHFHFVNDIIVNAEGEEEADVLVDSLDPNITRYKMEKTKVMTNNPNGVQREIKIKGQTVQTMEICKYLEPFISNKGSKSEILSRIAWITAALSRLKII